MDDLGLGLLARRSAPLTAFPCRGTQWLTWRGARCLQLRGQLRHWTDGPHRIPFLFPAGKPSPTVLRTSVEGRQVPPSATPCEPARQIAPRGFVPPCPGLRIEGGFRPGDIPP